jgi:rhamnogalacturonyl hydrolase YesR
VALAFLGNGHVPEGKRYAETVEDALGWLVGQQRSDGGIGLTPTPRYMLNHAAAATALAEGSAMTGRREYEQAAKRAADFILASRTDQAAWGYTPGADPAEADKVVTA